MENRLIMPNINWLNIYGFSRGSTFVFNYLSKHPQITGTRKKEPLYIIDDIPEDSLANYYKVMFLNIKIKDGTRFILDGTPYWPVTEGYWKMNRFLNDLDIGSPYLIYLFKEPYSVLKSMIVRACKHGFFDIDWALSDYFKFESLKILKRIESVIPKDNIYICCIENFINDIVKLYDFLNLEYCELNDSNIYKNHNNDIIKYWPHASNQFKKYESLINRYNESLSWVYDDYKQVDDIYGTNLVEFYNLTK